MPDIELVNPQELANAIPNKPLGDHAVLVNVLKANIDKAPNTGIEGVSVSLGAGTSVTIQGFNSKTDKDDDGILGLADTTKPEELGPQFTLGEKGWLKYKADARVKAALDVDTSFLATDIAGELSVALSDYHSHELTENARQALLDDVLHLRLATRASDLENLKPQDAMAFQVRGFLKVALELKWSDVFTSNLGALTRLLQSDTLLGLKTTLGATLSATATLKDDFLVVFSRPAAGRIRVGVSKATSRGIDPSAKLGVDIQFKDPDVVEEVLTGVLEGLAGFALTDVDQLLDKAASNALDPQSEQQLGTFILRLGLEHLKDNPPALLAEWKKLQDDTRKTIEDIATAKLTAGVSYEYLRVSTESTLLQTVLSDADARTLHPYFLKGNLAHVVDWMKQNDRQPEKYLNQRMLQQSSVLGFSLGFGDWALRSKDSKKVEYVTQKNFQDAKRIAYLGVRSYEGSLFGLETTKVSFDFKGDMETFVKNPSASDLNYGLHLVIQHEGGKPTENRLRHAIDAAIVWRVLDEAHEEEVHQQFSRAVANAQRVETLLEVKLEDSRIREILPLIAAADPTPFALALGRSMPWDTMRARSVVDLRQRAYAPLWLEYLKHPGLDMKGAANLAYHELRKNPVSNDLALLQSERRLTPGIWSFAQLVTAQTSTAAKWQTFTEGARNLQQAILSGKEHTAFGPTFEKMEDLCRVSFQLKALGAYLLQLCLQTPRGLNGVERTLTVRLKDHNDQEQQLLFTTGR